MHAPNQHSKGYLSGGPILLGKGFGPKPYVELFDVWTITRTKTLADFEDRQKDRARILLKLIAASDSNEQVEGFLSGLTSVSLNHLLSTFHNPKNNLGLLHQASTTASGEYADGYVVDLDADSISVHGMLEMKLFSTRGAPFPEMQACVHASKFDVINQNPREWMPVFVLSQEHLRIGVAFNKVFAVWAYADIFSSKFSLHRNSDQEDAVVLLMLQFASFMHAASVHHKTRSSSRTDFVLMDKSKDTLLSGDPFCEPIGNRVLQGKGGDGTKMVLKFYENKDCADAALKKQQDLHEKLGYPPCQARLCEGVSSDSVGAVLDHYIKSYIEMITKDHLINVTKQIGTLYQQGWLHGDVRKDNLLCLPSGDVRLIDSEMSGAVGTAVFPANINKAAFGPINANIIGPGELIPQEFDYRCLSTLFATLNMELEAEEAFTCSGERILELLEERSSVAMRIPRPVVLQLNLGILNERLDLFYGKSTTPSEGSSAGSMLSESLSAESRKRHRED